MQFSTYLTTFPSIEHLECLEIFNADKQLIHTIPAIEGKLGSLKLYNALAEKYSCRLTPEAAAQGLEWFAEHVADAQQNPGKHPNIDLLFKVINEQLSLDLAPIVKK